MTLQPLFQHRSSVPECMRILLTTCTQHVMKKPPMTFQLTHFLTQLPDALECSQAMYAAVMFLFDPQANNRLQPSTENISEQPIFHMHWFNCDSSLLLQTSLTVFHFLPFSFRCKEHVMARIFAVKIFSFTSGRSLQKIFFSWGILTSIISQASALCRCMTWEGWVLIQIENPDEAGGTGH